MGLIVRIDVDRPYGKQGFIRHVASRIASDYYLPPMQWLQYLDELKTILTILNENKTPSWVFFRKCTYPTDEIQALMQQGGHHYGLHLENSRTADTFRDELTSLEQKLGFKVEAFSKHGSGRYRYGWHHFAPYEPQKYIVWALQAGLKLFLGNLEDPQLTPSNDGGLLCFPSAFWLEPHWRDTNRFPIQWLLSEIQKRDIVMLLHPDNVVSSPEIMREFRTVIENVNLANRNL
jgi:hypothetical protein